MQRPIQNEADEVAEVLWVKGAARRPAHVRADSQWYFLHFRVASITEKKYKDREPLWSVWKIYSKVIAVRCSITIHEIK